MKTYNISPMRLMKLASVHSPSRRKRPELFPLAMKRENAHTKDSCRGPWPRLHCQEVYQDQRSETLWGNRESCPAGGTATWTSNEPTFWLRGNYTTFKSLPAAQNTAETLITYLMSSSLANIMTPRAFEVSISLIMALSNVPGFGSLGIFSDWAMHRPP